MDIHTALSIKTPLYVTASCGCCHKDVIARKINKPFLSYPVYACPNCHSMQLTILEVKQFDRNHKPITIYRKENYDNGE